MASHTWKFFRAGGFDQVRLDSAAELLAIGELDQKLWVALSCPVKGIEFDARTLQLIDGDADGQVRAPELIAAVKWAGERLTDTEVLGQSLPGVPLAVIRDDDEAGAAIAAAAKQLAADLGKSDADIVSVEEASAAQVRFAEKALAAWEAAGAEAKPLGDATQAALDAMNAVAAKVEDYFVRCRLAAFDERAGAALNAAEEVFTSLSSAMLTADAAGVAALPLAKVGAGGTVPLGDGVNPAWAGAIAALRDAAVTPLLGSRETLSEADWQALKDRLAPYAAWLFIAYVPAIVFVGPVRAHPGHALANANLLPTYADYYWFISAAIVVFSAFVAPELLCTDRRTGMLGLYLASPLTRTTYGAKAVSVVGLLALVTLGPPLLLLVAVTLVGRGPTARGLLRLSARWCSAGSSGHAPGLAVAGGVEHDHPQGGGLRRPSSSSCWPPAVTDALVKGGGRLASCSA